MDSSGSSGLAPRAMAYDVLPVTKTWALVASSSDPDQTTTPVTWLRIVNDLAEGINFRGVWCDEGGLFRLDAYRAPTSRAPEFTLDADDLLAGIVGEDRTVTADVWGVPNRWVFRQSKRASGSPTASEGDGVYTYNLPDAHPLSAVSRGLVWTSVVDYESATHAALVALGARRVALDLAVSRRVDLMTGPLPVLGHADVLTLLDAAAGLSGKAQVVTWRQPLDGGDVTMTLEMTA